MNRVDALAGIEQGRIRIYPGRNTPAPGRESLFDMGREIPAIEEQAHAEEQNQRKQGYGEFF